MSTPHCTLHVGIEMVLTDGRRPDFRWSKDRIAGGYKPPTEGQPGAARRAWRCPITGCPRVERFEEHVESIPVSWVDELV